MTSQVPFEPLTPAALAKLTEGEQATYARAVQYVRDCRVAPYTVLVGLAGMVHRLVSGEPEGGETPGYWQVRAVLSSALNGLQLIALSPYGDIAAMAREALAKADATLSEAVPESFGDRFTAIPDSGAIELHCSSHVPEARQWPVGYHPSLDVLIEHARAHNAMEHAAEAGNG